MSALYPHAHCNISDRERCRGKRVVEQAARQGRSLEADQWGIAACHRDGMRCLTKLRLYNNNEPRTDSIYGVRGCSEAAGQPEMQLKGMRRIRTGYLRGASSSRPHAV